MEDWPSLAYGAGFENQCGEIHRGFESLILRHADVTQWLEYLVANEDVVGSNPIIRSTRV